jgi:hypothetical protein
LHFLLLCTAVAVLAMTPFNWVWRVLIAAILILVAPAATVAYRKQSSIHRFNLLHALALYELYFLARINAGFSVAARRVRATLGRRHSD